jgi:hypothetical protein
MRGPLFVAALASVLTTLPASSLMAAQAPGTYQKTMACFCKGACEIKFDGVPSKILLIERVNCGIQASVDPPLNYVTLSNSKDGTIFLPIQPMATNISIRRYVVNAEVQFQVSPGTSVEINFSAPNNGVSYSQFCTLMGRTL